jgi:hypothetical protein
VATLTPNTMSTTTIPANTIPANTVANSIVSNDIDTLIRYLLGTGRRPASGGPRVIVQNSVVQFGAQDLITVSTATQDKLGMSMTGNNGTGTQYIFDEGTG